MKCEICGKEQVVFSCDICGRKICEFCARLIEKPSRQSSWFSGSGTFYAVATTAPYPSYTYETELVLCKFCCDRLKLSLRIASVPEEEVSEEEEIVETSL